MNDDAAPIAPGTPCFLVRLVDFQWLAGRIVTVVRALRPPPDGEVGEWYRIESEWALAMFAGRQINTPRGCLKPLTPPERAAAKREGELLEVR